MYFYIRGKPNGATFRPRENLFLVFEGGIKDVSLCHIPTNWNHETPDRPSCDMSRTVPFRSSRALGVASSRTDCFHMLGPEPQSAKPGLKPSFERTTGAATPRKLRKLVCQIESHAHLQPRLKPTPVRKVATVSSSNLDARTLVATKPPLPASGKWANRGVASEP